jgi:hypothetical protein
MKISASRAGKRSSLFIDNFPDPSTNLPDVEKSISSDKLSVQTEEKLNEELIPENHEVVKERAMIGSR